MKLPNEPRRGDPIEGWARDVIRYLRATRIIGISGGAVKESPNGTSLDLPDKTQPQTFQSSPCPFGQIIGLPTGSDQPTGIRGGSVTCGDSNFDVVPYPVDTSGDGDQLISIKLTGILCNTDDDTQVILPGILSVSGTPDWDSVAYADGYHSNTNPSYPDDNGTIYVPLGRLKITDGAISWTPTGCGSIIIDQCGGILTFSRV